MAAITVAHYQNIMNYYDTAQIQTIGLADYYYDAAVEILLLDDFDPELALLEPFYNAYLATQSAYVTPPTAVINAVGSLQRHVLDKARTETTPGTSGIAFTNINTWLDANATQLYITSAVKRYGDVDTSFKLTKQFANLSDLAGFAIDAKNRIA